MKALLDLTDEITHAQVRLERVETTLGEVVDEYFNSLSNNPDTPEGRGLIALYFNQNRVLSDIARDYVIQIRETLADMRGLIAKAQRNNPNGQGAL